MDRLLYHAILLAERSRLDSLSSGFRGRRARFQKEDLVIGLLILGGIALAVWILSYALKFQEQRRSRPGPLRLFLSLCKAHRLRWSQRWLLWRVARARQLRDPARLFLEPEMLETADLGRSFETRQAQLNRIRHRLFGRFEQPQQHHDPPGAGDGRLPARRQVPVSDAVVMPDS